MCVSLDDWDKLRLYRGQRITLQRGPGRPVPMFLAEVTDAPPVTWVMLANVARAAGCREAAGPLRVLWWGCRTEVVNRSQSVAYGTDGYEQVRTRVTIFQGI